MVNIGISGVCGKMGRRIASLALKDPSMKIAAALERVDSTDAGKDLGTVLGHREELGVKVATDLAKISGKVDCFIEFTLPGPTLEHLEICRAKGIPMVIGTTGMDAEGENKIKKAAEKIPIVFSPNMAVGVNLLFKIVAEAAKVLAPDFKIKVDETHHVHKKDSPSGTAKMIARVIKEAGGVDAPVSAFREGEVVGNHGIIFESEYEELEIRHDAKSRDVFAAGALKAAAFVADKKPGLYSMADVLGIK